MKKALCIMLCIVFINLGLVTGVRAADLVVRQDLEKYFGGFTGTFVMYDETNDRLMVFNEQQSLKPLSPCSTFKIYHSLIALETGVLDPEDANTLIQWDETQYSFESWNRDQTLASATRNSVVWYFQAVASRIGKERMQEYIDKLAYGNRDISGGLTDFWLRSSLQISAREQVDLLRRLYAGQLPFSARNVEIVKMNITQSKTEKIWFMGKTGSARQGGRSVTGWFVGCVEKQGSRYFFATSITALDGANGGKASEIAKNILNDLGFLSDS